MVAEVKWIKIVTDVFDDEKILMIETLPEADSIIVIWFKLLCLAGKKNNCGVFQMGRMPYTDEMFATIFRRPINTIRLALNAFEKYGMIEIINNTVTIPNWNKHQSLDALEKKKERDRLYQSKRRAEQKALLEKSSDESSDIASQIRVEEKRKEKSRKEVDVEESKNNGGTDSEDNTFELFGGTLGKNVVLLTPAQQESLLEQLGLDAFNFYMDKLSTFIIQKNAKVGNHYATILKWAKEDAKL